MSYYRRISEKEETTSLNDQTIAAIGIGSGLLSIASFAYTKSQRASILSELEAKLLIKLDRYEKRISELEKMVADLQVEDNKIKQTMEEQSRMISEGDFSSLRSMATERLDEVNMDKELEELEELEF